MQRMVVQLSLGAAESTIVIDGLPYTPDIGYEMMNRAKDGLVEAVKLAWDQGVPDGEMPGVEYDDSAESLEELLGGIDGDE